MTIKARCTLPMTDPRRIKTARDLVIEIMKEVIAHHEAFQSSRDVYLEMAENHKAGSRDQYPAEKKQKTEHAPAGAAGGQGPPKGGQGAPKGERVACTSTRARPVHHIFCGSHALLACVTTIVIL